MYWHCIYCVVDNLRHCQAVYLEYYHRFSIKRNSCKVWTVSIQYAYSNIYDVYNAYGVMFPECFCLYYIGGFLKSAPRAECVCSLCVCRRSGAVYGNSIRLNSDFPRLCTLKALHMSPNLLYST